MEQIVELAGKLTESVDSSRVQEFAERINSLIQPAQRISADDIYVRSMLVASEELNSQGGRFPVEELRRLCELIPGCPVLVGHNKRSLPIARCFSAELSTRVDRGGNWVKVYFYWLKASNGADDLRANIDGGVYSECSLGFAFQMPECSVCGGDLRKCSHTPGCEYELPSGEYARCHYLYRGVTSVNEISIVYRGAVPDTKIGSVDLVEDPVGRAAGRDGSFELFKHASGEFILSLCDGVSDIDYLMRFPSLSTRLLRSGMSVVGQLIEHEIPNNEMSRVDSGACTISQRRRYSQILSFSGDRLKGEYLLRESVWNGRKAIVLRSGCTCPDTTSHPNGE